MIQTLQTMSGTRHQVFKDSKTIQQDLDKPINSIDGKISVSMSTKEVPVISYNNMAFIDPRNSIVFRAGDPPIWNKNEMILPMSWRLFSNQIAIPGKKYSLQSIPTTSTVMEFDVRKNQPDFNEMLEKRITQATKVKQAKDMYADIYNYDSYAISQLDPDVYAHDIMDIINALIRIDVLGNEDGSIEKAKETRKIDYKAIDHKQVEENEELKKEANAAKAELQEHMVKRYANNQISREQLISKTSGVMHEYDRDIINAYQASRMYMIKDTENFRYVEGRGLYSADGRVAYILEVNVSDELRNLNEQAKDPENSNVFFDGDIESVDVESTKKVTDEFYKFLISWDKWTFAEGEFDREFANYVQNL